MTGVHWLAEALADQGSDDELAGLAQSGRSRAEAWPIKLHADEHDLDNLRRRGRRQPAPSHACSQRMATSRHWPPSPTAAMPLRRRTGSRLRRSHTDAAVAIRMTLSRRPSQQVRRLV